jgi:hypothetical protein
MVNVIRNFKGHNRIDMKYFVHPKKEKKNDTPNLVIGQAVDCRS